MTSVTEAGGADGAVTINHLVLCAAAIPVCFRSGPARLVADGVAALPCLRSVVTRETDLGPLAATFYATYGGQPSIAARKQLLADLGAAFTVNAVRIKAKRTRLRIAIFSLFVGLVLACSLIALDTPTTMQSMVHPSQSSPAPLPPAPVSMPGPSPLPHVGPGGILR